MAGVVEARLARLGIELPPPFEPMANFVGTVRTGNLLYVSGTGPTWGKEIRFAGKVGGSLDIETGRQAARLTALNILSLVRQSCGDLDRIVRCVKLFGLVNSAPGFTDQHLVVNGGSDVLGEVLAERAPHARSAVAAPSLPFDIAVELDAVFEIA